MSKKGLAVAHLAVPSSVHVRRWSSVYHVRWAPMLTYSSGRLRLLEWVNHNLKPLAFVDSQDNLGLELGRPGLRVVIRSDGLELSDAAAADGGGMDEIRLALDGIFETLKPRAVHVTAASLSWSGTLPSLVFAEAASRYAGAVAPNGPYGFGLDIKDVSILADFSSNDFLVQAEWGVVDQAQLMQRLTDRDIGRIRAGRPPARIVSISALPPVSSFVDTFASPHHEVSLEDSVALLSYVRDIDILCGQVAEVIHAGVEKKVVENHE